MLRRNALQTIGLPCLITGFAIVWSLGLIAMRGAGEPRALSLAVFPPWWGEKRVFMAAAASGSRIVGPGPVDWLLIVSPDTRSQTLGLKAEGAVFLLNAAAAKACSTGATALSGDQST